MSELGDVFARADGEDDHKYYKRVVKKVILDLNTSQIEAFLNDPANFSDSSVIAVFFTSLNDDDRNQYRFSAAEALVNHRNNQYNPSADMLQAVYNTEILGVGHFGLQPNLPKAVMMDIMAQDSEIAEGAQGNILAKDSIDPDIIDAALKSSSLFIQENAATHSCLSTESRAKLLFRHDPDSEGSNIRIFLTTLNHKTTTAEQLSGYAKRQNEDIRTAVAAHKNTSTGAIGILINDPNELVRGTAYGNENIGNVQLLTQALGTLKTDNPDFAEAMGAMVNPQTPLKNLMAINDFVTTRQRDLTGDAKTDPEEAKIWTELTRRLNETLFIRTKTSLDDKDDEIGLSGAGGGQPKYQPA